MNKRHPYNNIIERKLEQLPAADADLLWNDMHSVLDKKMPQKKERRRFIVWFLSSNGLLLLSIGLVVLIGSSLFFLSTKGSSAVTIKKLPSSQQPNKLIEAGLAKVSQEAKENITTVKVSGQKNRNDIYATTASGNSSDHVIANSSITVQTIKQPKKYTTTDQFNQPIHDIPKTSENFDIAPVNLESIHHSPIETDINEEKKYLSPQLEPVANKVKLNTRNNNERGFYAGVMLGVDMSSVHFQSAKTGGTAGFIIGYTFNEK